MDNTVLITLIPLIPLIGFALWGTVGKRMSRATVGGLATACVAVSFVLGLVAFRLLAASPDHQLTGSVYNWMTVPGLPGGRTLSLDIAWLLDPLSLTMTLIITGVGALIHFYAMGYMAHDARYSRFFSILNLFVGFMLVLVLANSFTLMFVGWEGVGLCSYLLIGFWWEDMANAAAGTKAFIVNRIGDFGFLSAMLWIFAIVGSLNFRDVFAHIADPAFHQNTAIGLSVISGITLLLFLGATGKSAQIPLFVWLPDAMAGPTPVSALIHAATMVTAGVYMIARCWVMFDAAPVTAGIVAIIGAVTAIMAASIAMVQYDMKKVLAYSTVSQLGYMFIGVGVGAYASGVFHLFTHAFFKACLFLGAGAVMHGLANNIDMRYMGNLKKYMPATRWTYLIAVLAIAGIFPFAGFWSKDDILAAAFDRGAAHPIFYVIWAIGLLTAFMTAMYMMRSYLMAFEGEERIDWAALKAAAAHGHGHGATDHEESPTVPPGTGAHAAGDLEADHHEPIQVAEHEKAHLIHELPGMSFVLWVLAALSTVAGFLLGAKALFPSWPESLSFEHWLAPALSTWWAPGAAEPAEAAAHASLATHWILAAVSLVAALLGFLVAWLLQRAKELDRAGVPQPFYTIFANLWGVDATYNRIFQKGGLAFGVWMWQIFDARVIDGIVNGTAALVAGIGSGLRRWNTGFVRSYAFSILVGVIIIVGYLVFYAVARTPATAAPVAGMLGRGAF